MTEKPPYAKDLVVLVADLDAENALLGLLSRSQSLGIRALKREELDIHRHIQRDPGCRGEADSFLRSFNRSHRYALVVFDHHGCGRESEPAIEIEADVESRLTKVGWKDRCCAIVLDPELEVWVWNDSPVVDTELGWYGRQPNLREWMVAQRLLNQGEIKPANPKFAMEKALRCVGKPGSPRLFSNIAEKVGLIRCMDRGFIKLRKTLKAWFPLGTKGVENGEASLEALA